MPLHIDSKRRKKLRQKENRPRSRRGRSRRLDNGTASIKAASSGRRQKGAYEKGLGDLPRHRYSRRIYAGVCKTSANRGWRCRNCFPDTTTCMEEDCITKQREMLIGSRRFCITSVFPAEPSATPTDKLIACIDAELERKRTAHKILVDLWQLMRYTCRTVPACPTEKEVTMASQKQQYTILYGRLSQEDERAGESNSILHQQRTA